MNATRCRHDPIAALAQQILDLLGEGQVLSARDIARALGRSAAPFALLDAMVAAGKLLQVGDRYSLTSEVA